MRAVTISEPGGPDVLSWGEVPEQAKEPGEVVAGLDLVQLSVAGPDPVAALAEAAENLGPDLLLVGGERRHGLDRLVHSSAAERIARTFSVGTLFLSRGAQGLVHPGTGRLELRRVMVPVGDEIQAQDALSAALAFLSAVRAFDTVIDLLHVSPSPVDMPAVIVPDGVKVEWRWTSSPVVPGILAEIHATHPNLVVMVTRGHDSLADALAGSRTERVMREAPCPVLAVPLEL